MRVLVAMSGGVDSSVAAALLAEAGHEVVGATLKLWGGSSDSGCCSVADVDDARRVAQQLGIAHHVFDLTDDFAAAVVEPYVAAHAAGRTPNPCIECNRHIKFARLLDRARRLGFDKLATGHHARVEPAARRAPSGARNRRPDAAALQLLRGVDGAKDQSYVLSMLGQDQLARLALPVGALTKAEVRARAARLGLRTAGKPDSQDVCFIRRDEGRRGFLAGRLELHPAEVVDLRSGRLVGSVPEAELVTVGQRRGVGHGPDGRRRYVVAVDVRRRRVTVAGPEDAVVRRVALAPGSVTWVGAPLPLGARALAQVSAHGRAAPCTVAVRRGEAAVEFDEPQRPVAPGQTVALYDPSDPDAVLGAGVAA
ncbi:MAG TPA: tRNA 2-thiouridine(34) synthase MnmA [Acidimicrobiales bacterium]|nr:tRNA 2-thiouridine(34) synthase MnmA [Acidimicrobiales bacterium]